MGIELDASPMFRNQRMSALPPKADMLDYSDDFIEHSRAMLTAALREK